MNTLKTTLAAIIAATSLNVSAGGIDDDPTLTYFKADKLEIRDADEGNVSVMEFDAWRGKDLNKFWLKYSRESLDGTVEGSEIDLLHSKAFTAFWDIQYGIRQVIDPESETWIGAGFNGVAPYLFEIDANVFINEDGIINARIDAEYEYMLTQKVILVPSIEVSIYSEEDTEKGIVSGIASTEIGVRLQYAVKRNVLPYIGINVEKAKGSSSETHLLGGISFWF